jgi:hypothetical protein
MTVIAQIHVPQFYSTVEKKDGEYVRTWQHGPGQRKQRATISELKAAELCALSDWSVCDALKEAKSSRFPYQALLAELMDL